MVTSCYQELSGTVLRTNERGLVLSGRDGWLNLSKFSNATLPAPGARVRVGLDKAGFIRDVQPEPTAERPTAPPAPAAAPRNLDARIAALQAATVIVARGSSLDAVLSAAERLEGWLTR